MRVLPSVYRVAAAPESQDQLLIAAWLWSKGRAVVSHRSAAFFLRLDGFDAIPVDISIAASSRSPDSLIVLHVQRMPRLRNIVKTGMFTLTDATRTLIDLGSVVDEPTVEAALEDALRRRLTTTKKIEAMLRDIGGPGRRGSGVLRAIMEARGPQAAAAESILEVRLLRLMKASGLPAPIRQHEVRVKGRVVARLDLAYPQSRLAIECDGFRWHGGREAWQRDVHRSNALVGLGWRVIHVTWSDIEVRSGDVIADIRLALEGGSEGLFAIRYLPGT